MTQNYLQFVTSLNNGMCGILQGKVGPHLSYSYLCLHFLHSSCKQVWDEYSWPWLTDNIYTKHLIFFSSSLLLLPPSTLTLSICFQLWSKYCWAFLPSCRCCSYTHTHTRHLYRNTGKNIKNNVYNNTFICTYATWLDFTVTQYNRVWRNELRLHPQSYDKSSKIRNCTEN